MSAIDPRDFGITAEDLRYAGAAVATAGLMVAGWEERIGQLPDLLRELADAIDRDDTVSTGNAAKRKD